MKNKDRLPHEAELKIVWTTPVGPHNIPNSQRRRGSVPVFYSTLGLACVWRWNGEGQTSELHQESGVRSHCEGQRGAQAAVGRAGMPGLEKVAGRHSHMDKEGSGGSFGRV